jgi:hypothetical protein
MTDYIPDLLSQFDSGCARRMQKTAIAHIFNLNFLFRQSG